HPKGVQATVAAVPILVLTDVCYTSLLNSFYMDAAAFSSLLLMAGAAVWISAGKESRPAQLGLFFVAALLFVTSKPQHAIWCCFPALFMAVSGTRARLRSLRVPAAGMAAIILAAGVYIERTADRGYKGLVLFDVLFNRIGLEGP